jgi:restriction system protein
MFPPHQPHVYSQQGYHPAYRQPIITGMSPALLASATAPDRPAVLLQAVVTLRERTWEGHIIEAVAPAWAEIVRLVEQDPDTLFKVDHRKLEEMIAGWYMQYGFDEVTLTPPSGDFGRDVIAVKHGVLSVRVVDQVKAYKPKHLVTAEEVRALGFVLSADRNATKGLVTTTSDFAPRITEDPLIKPYLPHRIELVNGAELVKRLTELGGKE